MSSTAGNRTPSRSRHDRWDDYLTAFHGERPGITDAVLSRAVDDEDRDPYQWLAEALPEGGVIVDVACGNAPLASRPAGAWMGVDRNLAELARAAPAARGRVVLADASAVPLTRSRHWAGHLHVSDSFTRLISL